MFAFECHFCSIETAQKDWKPAEVRLRGASPNMGMSCVAVAPNLKTLCLIEVLLLLGPTLNVACRRYSVASRNRLLSTLGYTKSIYLKGKNPFRH